MVRVKFDLTVTESVMGKTSKILFGTFALLALILVVAVFAAVAGKTLANTPEVVIPTFGLILVALVVGFLMYRVQLPVLLCSIIGVLLLFGLIVAGYYLPVELPVENAENAVKIWTVILLIYQAYGFATAEGTQRSILLAVVSVILVFFAFFLAYAALVAVAGVRKNGAPQEATSN